MPSIFDTPTNPEPEPPPSPAPSDDGLRVGDVERQEALSTINDSYVAGRIDATELERRTAQAAAAVTRGDLRGATANLPGTQAIAQSFTSRLNELRAGQLADEERRQKEAAEAAAEAAAGAQEAAAVAARLFREFATSLKDIVPPRPIATTHEQWRKPFLSKPRSEEIISPPGYQLAPNPGVDHARNPNDHNAYWHPPAGPVTVIVADGRIWQSTQLGTVNPGKGYEEKAWYWAGYVEPTPQFLFERAKPGPLDLPPGVRLFQPPGPWLSLDMRSAVLFHRAGLPYVRKSRIDADETHYTEEPLENWLAERAADWIRAAERKNR